MTVKRLFTAIIFCLAGLNVLQAQQVETGVWRGLIGYEPTSVPFTFEVSQQQEGPPVVILRNGSEVIKIENSRWLKDSLVIPMHVFDAEIITHVSDQAMHGRWVKHYKSNASIPFTAALNQPRFSLPANSRKPVKLPERLKITMQPPQGMPYDNLGLFEQDGQYIRGTIMTEVGDFRYFEGMVNKDSLVASSFDGVHAFLLTGHFNGKTWQGELTLDDNYVEPWTGVDGTDFKLKDPFVTINPADPAQAEPYFDILTAGSGFGSLDKEDFLGKVTIIQLMGSWCPNSLDETNYLKQWYAENREQEIAVLAVFYEMNYSKAYGIQRINDYVEQNEIPYQTALGGPANKGQAALAFPFVSKLEAFPTLMILDKSGRVRFMNTYFQGPATGEYYREFDRRFREIVDGLLAE